MHHADAGADRRPRPAGRQFGALDMDRSRIRYIVAEEDAHQCRLAGAVFAEQRQHFALGEAQRNILIGLDGAEALADAGKLKHGS